MLMSIFKKIINKISWWYIRIFSVTSTVLFWPLLLIIRKVEVSNSLKKLNHYLDKPVIMVSNHQTLLDFLAMFGALGPKNVWQISPVKFMTWHRIYYSIAWPILYSTGCFPTHRSKHSGVSGALYYLKNDYELNICPEGKRMPSGKRKKAYQGISKILESIDQDYHLLLIYIDWAKREKIFSRPKLIIRWAEAPKDTDISDANKIMDKVYDLSAKM